MMVGKMIFLFQVCIPVSFRGVSPEKVPLFFADVFLLIFVSASTNGKLVFWGPVVWDSIGGTPKNPNPFHNGILGIQTTGTQITNESFADPAISKKFTRTRWFNSWPLYCFYPLFGGHVYNFWARVTWIHSPSWLVDSAGIQKTLRGEAVSRGVELVAAISAPSDEQFASTITQVLWWESTVGCGKNDRGHDITHILQGIKQCKICKSMVILRDLPSIVLFVWVVVVSWPRVTMLVLCWTLGFRKGRGQLGHDDFLFLLHETCSNLIDALNGEYYLNFYLLYLPGGTTKAETMFT